MNTVYKIEIHQEAVVWPRKAIAPQTLLKFLERSPHLVLLFAGMDYRFVDRIQKASLLLIDGTEIPISRNRKKVFDEALFHFLRR